MWALPEAGRVRRLSFRRGCVGYRLQATKTDGQKRTSVSVRKVSEVPDAHETLRKDVKEETTQELFYW